MSEFKFSSENNAKIKEIISKYPKGKQRSAIIELLYLAQKQNKNHLTKSAMDNVADILQLAPIRVYEIANFYTMFNLNSVGEYFIQICTTTPCWLKGSDQIVEACKSKLDVEARIVTNDGKFSYNEVECLGACVNAPMVQINDDYYEDLDKELMIELIENLQNNNKVTIGSQTKRQCSAPKDVSN